MTGTTQPRRATRKVHAKLAMQVQTHDATATPCYSDSYEHLVDEMHKLDLLLQWRIAAFQFNAQARPRSAALTHEFISDAEVNWLLQDAAHTEAGHTGDKSNRSSAALAQLERDIEGKVAASQARGVFLALPQLAHIFMLSPFEVQALVICLAPELHRKYDALYAYLQDDVTRKKPSVDLILNLLCQTKVERWRARAVLTPQSRLMRAEILQQVEDVQSPSGSSDLARFLKLSPRILGYLLGDNTPDAALTDIINLMAPTRGMAKCLVEPDIIVRMRNLTNEHFVSTADPAAGAKAKLVVHLHGPPGVGKRDLAQAICGELSCWLLYLDMQLLPAHEPEAEGLLRLLFREVLLLQAAVYLDNIQTKLSDDECGRAFASKLAQMTDEYCWLTFLAGDKPWLHGGRVRFQRAAWHSVALAAPRVPVREAAWSEALARIASLDKGQSEGVGMTERAQRQSSWAHQLAGQFRLTPGQIDDVVDYALTQRIMRVEAERGHIELADLYAACREQSNHKLGELAAKIEARRGWDDLILPAGKVTQLKEMCSQVKHRWRVFGEWGFDRKHARGKGLSALFSGASGTGKTMAAEVIAHELQLDLYKIDLSSVVSKYIGETEKNLSRVFEEAETSNAILFFDEADALFGKRTEVSDAHDRYANIETSYLLQKMEDYDGIVILATNLFKNMDEAFVRRLRFIVEFPFPDQASRRMIWQTHFPEQAPLSEGIDFDYLSRQFQIAGGNIRNIALNSAFLAAENGGVITMAHILHGTKREFEKVGKLWSETYG